MSGPKITAINLGDLLGMASGNDQDEPKQRPLAEAQVATLIEAFEAYSGIRIFVWKVGHNMLHSVSDYSVENGG